METDTSTPTLDQAEHRDEVLIEYVKEKESLRAELKEKEKEIIQQKARIYDLHEKVGNLQNEIKTLQAEKQNTISRQISVDTSSAQVSGNKVGAVRPTTARRTPQMKRAKSGKQRAPTTKQVQKAPTPPDVTPEPQPPVNLAHYISAVKTLEHYQEVATKFPELKLSIVLTAEKFFEECDINNDGTIDEEELEKLLQKQGHLFTNRELRDIMSQIDVDNNKAIDVMEYLAVMERLQLRKRVNLPQSLTKSTACAIQ